jgi:tetratricopeptide (TPR) repeat protein
MPSNRASSLCSVVVLLLCASGVAAQSDARERQAAAEAYDQGTTAYLAGDYEKAAQWFETANRMSPAAPALIQAARAHKEAGHTARAATLALNLLQNYPDDATANEFAQGMLSSLADGLVRVDVSCDGCTLDVDGTLQETQSFFVDPGSAHTVTAGFETGERTTEVAGVGGETKELRFDAPPPPPDTGTEPPEIIDPPPRRVDTDDDRPPLPPIVTFIGIGVTGALLAASIVSFANMESGVPEYEEAAMEYNTCLAREDDPNDCDPLYEDAKDLLDEGESKEALTTGLFIGTGVAAVATTIIAFALTDWEGDDDEGSSAEESLTLAPTLVMQPTRGSALLAVEGRF